MRGRFHLLSEPPKLTDPRLIVLRDRLFRTIALVAQVIPAVAKHQDAIQDEFDKGVAEHQDKLAGAYVIALAELKKPIQDDGITNIVETVAAANRELQVGSQFSQRLTQSYIRGELDDPKIRPELPGLVRTMIATLEGNA